MPEAVQGVVHAVQVLQCKAQTVQDVCALRFPCQCLLITGDGFFNACLFVACNTAPVPFVRIGRAIGLPPAGQQLLQLLARGGKIRLRCQRCLEAVAGRQGQAPGPLQHAEVVLCHGIARRQGRGLCIGRCRRHRIALTFQCRAQVVPCLVVAGIALQRHPEALAGPGQVGGIGIGEAQVVVGIRLVGGQGNGLLATGDCHRQIAQPPPDLAQIGLIRRHGGRQAGRIAHPFRRMRQPAAPERQQAEQVPGLMGGRMVVQQAVALLFRQGEVADAHCVLHLAQGLVRSVCELHGHGRVSRGAAG